MKLISSNIVTPRNNSIKLGMVLSSEFNENYQLRPIFGPVDQNDYSQIILLPNGKSTDLTWITSLCFTIKIISWITQVFPDPYSNNKLKYFDTLAELKEGRDMISGNSHIIFNSSDVIINPTTKITYETL